MSSISCARTSYVDTKANRIHLNALLVSAAGVRNVIQLFAVALGAASLAACAQSSVVTQKSELGAASRQASLEHNRKTSFVTNRRVARSEEHTSELQSLTNLVCRLLLEKKKKKKTY